jgi:diguanylate cyclase (GGDEF)-like protein/PAS domain S-box-containing protein
VKDEEKTKEELINDLIELRTKIASLTKLNVERTKVGRKKHGENTPVSETLYQTIFENAGSASIIIERDSTISLANEEFERLSGYDRKELEGNIKATKFVVPEDLEKIREFHSLWMNNPDSIPNKYEFSFIDRHGTRKRIIQKLYRMPGKEKILVSFLDITDFKKVERHLYELATHDELTKLPNRRFFMERLEHAMVRSQRHKQILALLYMDLDNLKSVNDKHGHFTGDVLLKRVAQRMLECVRGNDTVARVGGDEFNIILEDTYKLDDIVKVADRIVEALEKPFIIDVDRIRITASIGISLYPQNGRNSEDLLRKADEAMYRVKKNGKNGYQFCSKITSIASKENY